MQYLFLVGTVYPGTLQNDITRRLGQVPGSKIWRVPVSGGYESRNVPYHADAEREMGLWKDLVNIFRNPSISLYVPSLLWKNSARKIVAGGVVSCVLHLRYYVNQVWYHIIRAIKV